MSLRSIRRAVATDDLHTVAASVQILPQFSKQYDINVEGDLIVSCELHRGQAPVWANASTFCGGGGNGIWRIPDVGTEVILATDSGEFEGELYLIGTFPTGKTPQNLVPGQMLLVSSQVLIQDAADQASDSMIRGSTYRSKEDVLFSAFSSFGGALSTYVAAIKGIADPTNAATPAMTTACTTMQNAVLAFQAQASSYLSNVGKVQ